MKKAIGCYVISICVVVMSFYFEFISVASLVKENINEYQFNIITINSIFAGFLFTGLSTILSASNTRTVQTLIKAKRIQKIYYNLFIGILTNLISILVCIFVVLRINVFCSEVLVKLEIILIVIGVEALLISLHYLYKIIHYINDDYKKISDKTKKMLEDLNKKKD